MRATTSRASFADRFDLSNVERNDNANDANDNSVSSLFVSDRSTVLLQSNWWMKYFA